MLDMLLKGYKVDSESVKTITPELIPDELNALEIETVYKECFNNAFRWAAELHIAGYKNVFYVLGFGESVVPVEHVIIKVGDNFYDPTWERYNELKPFHIVKEFTMAELSAALKTNDSYPPDLAWLSRQKK